MYHSAIIRKGIATLLFVQLIVAAAFAQNKTLVVSGISLKVNGTSTLHDWEMKATSGTCTADLTFSPAGQLTGITALSYTVGAETLKSEHSGMDSNAYKALKTKKNPNITFKITTSTVAADGSIKAQGQLTIAGVTKAVELTAKSTAAAGGKSVVIKGSKVINMTDFQVDPPSFMMGAMKTGNAVTISYEFTLHQ
ncbi:YceI family protein [Chitinophaga sp. LS1]|uniref:YceI family protein n=1 Tax=Chitinophaga sp. LS1 TaxID=3051176 RepID=UPI002AAC2E2D|nr:YceI family protein [Chitinophaga sp. LS1]WPV64139.1 YceI family protein [Chitinophaga sp. LS1]